MANELLTQAILQSLMRSQSPSIVIPGINGKIPSSSWTPNANDVRSDGTLKGTGYFGVLQRPGGGVSTEISTGTPINGKETEYPIIVPTLNTDEVNYLLTTPINQNTVIPQSIRIKAADFARGRINQGLSPFASNSEIPYGIALPPSNGSEAWQAQQYLDTKAASQAGIPAFIPSGEDSAARLRLLDAVTRAGSPHFIGTPNEPLGDRGVTMDIESLVNSLQAQEAAAIKSGDKKMIEKIRKEKAYWEKEAAAGMSDAEWRAQTGEPSPTR